MSTMESVPDQGQTQPKVVPAEVSNALGAWWLAVGLTLVAALVGWLIAVNSAEPPELLVKAGAVTLIGWLILFAVWAIILTLAAMVGNGFVRGRASAFRGLRLTSIGLMVATAALLAGPIVLDSMTGTKDKSVLGPGPGLVPVLGGSLLALVGLLPIFLHIFALSLSGADEVRAFFWPEGVAGALATDEEEAAIVGEEAALAEAPDEDALEFVAQAPAEEEAVVAVAPGSDEEFMMPESEELIAVDSGLPEEEPPAADAEAPGTLAVDELAAEEYEGIKTPIPQSTASEADIFIYGEPVEVEEADVAAVSTESDSGSIFAQDVTQELEPTVTHPESLDDQALEAMLEESGEHPIPAADADVTATPTEFLLREPAAPAGSSEADILVEAEAAPWADEDDVPEAEAIEAPMGELDVPEALPTEPPAESADYVPEAMPAEVPPWMEEDIPEALPSAAPMLEAQSAATPPPFSLAKKTQLSSSESIHDFDAFAEPSASQIVVPPASDSNVIAAQPREVIDIDEEVLPVAEEEGAEQPPPPPPADEPDPRMTSPFEGFKKK